MIRFVFVATLLLTSFVFASPSQQDLRLRYQTWLTNSPLLSFDEQQKSVDSLKEYVLYPYVEMQFIQNNLKMVSAESVTDFVKKHSDFPLTSTLIQQFLAELTNRQDWQAIKSFPHDNSVASICRYQYALFQLGEKQQAFEPLKGLWLTGKELPSACDPLLNSWTLDGNKTADLILLRIELAIKQNNIKLARLLTNQLPENYKSTKTNLLALLDNPKKLPDFSKNIHQSSFTKSIVLTLFPRLVKSDVDLAKTVMPVLIKQQSFTEEEQKRLEYSIANAYFSDSVTDEQARWRDEVILKSHETPLVEKRIRLSIDQFNYGDIAYWLGQLTPQEQLKEEWQFWQARVLLNAHKDSEANAILKTVSKNRGFYGMVSAQMLNIPYQLNNQSRAMTQSELSSLKAKYDNRNFIKRIDELRNLGMITESKREWRYYLNNRATQTEYLDLARYADSKNWGEFAIQATISGKLWDNWTERLPVLYKNVYSQAIKDKAISLSYALAITRQESAFDTAAQSPVGASGLMQLMPATAKDTARKANMVSYSSSSQLFDPNINIQLGTYYLNSVYLQNDNNRILSSAAYNAGPNRLKRWLVRSNSKLDVVAFIDSIPFTETRNYVKNVLVYDYVYQTILNQNIDGIFQKNELNRQY